MVEPHMVMIHVQLEATCATAAQDRKRLCRADSAGLSPITVIHLDVQHNARHQTPVRGYTFGVSIYPSDRCTVPTNVSKVPPPRSMKVRAPSRQRPQHQHRSTFRGKNFDFSPKGVPDGLEMGMVYVSSATIDTGLHDIVLPEPQGSTVLISRGKKPLEGRPAPQNVICCSTMEADWRAAEPPTMLRHTRSLHTMYFLLLYTLGDYPWR
ncbi:hypothetical protein QR685DRAFT_430744 [Neurospora intermedia]|uniref:Uncharacterized protein n=1 Tax=Neurospora intermedia TaxID=5142 RepID=A0ABR3DPG7_NEUIN